MKKIIMMLVATLVAAGIYAQQDSAVALSEVVVNTNKGAANRNKRQDGQATTEALLSGIPGVSLISRGNYAQEPVLRGFSGGQVNIVIDGMQVFGACTDRMDPPTSYIAPNNLKSIHIANGPSFDAGGATVGGAFNFNLKKPVLGDKYLWRYTAGMGYGTNAAERQALGNLQYSSQKFTVLINAIYRAAGNYRPGGNKNELIRQYQKWAPEKFFMVDGQARMLFSSYKKWNTGAALVYKLNTNHQLHADYILDVGKNIGYPALPMDVSSAVANIAALSYTYNNNARKLYSMETKMYYNDVNHIMDDTKRPAEQVLMHMDMPGYSRTWGVYNQMFARYAHHALQARAAYYANRWHAAMAMYPKDAAYSMYMLTIPDVQRAVTAISLQDEAPVSSSLRLKAGVHAELNTSDIYSPQGLAQVSVIAAGNVARNNFIWNAYLQPVWQGTHLIGDVKIARAARAATIKELYALYLLNRMDGYEYIGNPNLQPEQAWDIDAALQYSVGRVGIMLKGFSYFFKNYIAGITMPGVTATMSNMGVKQYKNIASARVSGGEVALQLRPAAGWLFFSNNAMQAGMDGNGNYLPLMSPFKSINKLVYEKAGFSIFAESVLAAAQQRVSNFYGEKKSPGYCIYNAGATKNWQVNKYTITVSLTGNNIFNKYYFENTDAVQLPRPGRDVVIKTTVAL